jgi:hypothetical protein
MAWGLVPIVPDAANIDYDDFGVRLELCSVEAIRDLVQELCCRAVPEVRERSDRARLAAHGKYSPEAFRDGLKNAISSAVARTAS